MRTMAHGFTEVGPMSDADFDRSSVVKMLKEVSQSERMVIDFQKVDGKIQAADITDHVEMLEKKVNND